MVAESADLQLIDGRVHVSGELGFDSVPALLDAGLRAMQGQSTLIFDLEQAHIRDSSAVALLLEWLKNGRQANIDIRYENLPEQLMNIARISDVAELLHHQA